MAVAVTETRTPAGEYQLAPIGHIVVDEGFNNRRSLGDIAELAASIDSVGVLQPLLVWRRELGLQSDATIKGKGFLHVIAGHRRLAAAKLAGLDFVPVIVVDQDERLRLESLLVENLHRLGLDPLEEADGYKRLLAMGLKQKEIAAKVGRSEAHVSKRLALIELPQEATDLFIAGKLSIADAIELTPYVKDPEVIAETLKAVKEAQRQGWGYRVSDHASGAARRLAASRAREAAIAKLREAKVSVINYDGYGVPNGATLLGKGFNELPLTATEHAKSPCHAAFIDHEGRVRYVCTKLATHKDSKDKAVAKAIAAINRYRAPGFAQGSDRGAKDAQKKAQASRERNKVLREREPVRIDELKRVLNAKQKRDVVLDFVLRQLLQRFLDESHEVEELAATLLGVGFKPTKHTYERSKVDWVPWLAGGSDRVFKLAYAIALASGEHPFRHLLKQGYFDGEYVVNAGRYIEHLQANGYKADKVELAQLGKPANAYQWRAPFDVAPKAAKK